MAAASSGLKSFYFFLGGVAVIGIVTLGYLVFHQPPISIPANVTVQASDTSGFHGYFLGSDSAPLTVTEYADYECPACQQFMTVQMPTIEERLIQTGQVRWRYRDFPLEQHPQSRVAAHAAACADEQGKYWEMNRLIYSWEPEWPLQRDASGVFRDYAKSLGLDLAKYDGCMKSARYAGRIEASREEGVRVGVQSTPTFLINNRLYEGGERVHYDMLKHLLDSLQHKAAS
ncbi:MAG TPA: thioredoxin domain-containing protein [Gemmatimonadales bacterium]|nr:thioredoxin domain-containing protein [Gemmatimonadales bacterium]